MKQDGAPRGDGFVLTTDGHNTPGGSRLQPEPNSYQNQWKLEPFQGGTKFIELVQFWWAEFGDAYTEYGPGAADMTGLAGQWADLYRKVMKLKRAFWEGDTGYLVRENEEEILRDIVSHAFLAMSMLKLGRVGGRAGSSPTA